MKTSPLLSLLVSLVVACGGSNPEPADPGASMPADEPADETWEEEAAVGVDEDSSEAGDEPIDESSDGDDDAEEAVGTDDEKPLGNTVEETRTTEVIRNVVVKNRESVRTCFDSLSKEEKGKGGTLTISFKLDPKGKVKEASVNQERTTLSPPKLTSCAIDAIKKMKFPPSSRGFESSVNYPFDFNP